MNERLLIIEDEPGLIMALTDCLTSEGYLVQSAADGLQGFERAAAESFDLIILDLMLPVRSGFDVCRDLRRRGISVPIIMLTARGQMIDKVVGLKLGADDYLTKPFDMPELLARIEALLRRSAASHKTAAADANAAPLSNHSPESYSFGPITVDFRRTEITRDGRPLELSAREFKLLQYLIRHRGQTISRDELLNEVWGYNAMPTTRTVDVHIGQLRQKIEPEPQNPQFILTIYGFGYKFAG